MATCIAAGDASNDSAGLFEDVTALGPEEVRRIPAVRSPAGLLAGGQPLVFRADHLQITLPRALRSGVTAEAGNDAARRHCRRPRRRMVTPQRKVCLPS